MFGALTSLFTGFAFAGVIVTMLMQNEDLRLQRKELAATREEIRGQRKQLEIQNKFIAQQNFESAFFQLLSQFNILISNIVVGPKENPKTGREALEDLFIRLRNSFYPLHIIPLSDADSRRYDKEREDIQADRELLVKEYNSFFDDHNDELGNYFRFLYNIIKFVHRSKIEDKEFYIGIVRAQLSSSETGLLLFNGLGRYGSGNMKGFIEQYSLLEHLSEDVRAEFKVMCESYNLDAFGLLH